MATPPPVEGIKDGSYTLARPFVVTTYGEVGEIAQDPAQLHHVR